MRNVNNINNINKNVNNIVNLPDILDRHMKNVNLAQLLALPVTRTRVRDFLAEFVEARVDLSLPLTFASIGLLAAVPVDNFLDFERIGDECCKKTGRIFVTCRFNIIKSFGTCGGSCGQFS